MSKVRRDFNIIIDEGLEYYSYCFKDLDELKLANTESVYCS